MTVWAVLPSTSLPTAVRFLSPTTTRLAPTSSAAARIESAGSAFSLCCTSMSTPLPRRSATSRLSADVCGYVGPTPDSPRVELTTTSFSARSRASSPARESAASPSGVGA